MAGPIFADRVQESSTTTGTGTYTLAGATTSFQAWSVVGNGNTAYYMATDGVNWEVGLGTYASSGTTLARTTILSSSNANAAVSWTAGTRTISLVDPAAYLTSVLVSGGPLGTPSTGVATNLTGTASGLTAGNVTTNANLTGPITSTGNATAIASQTGTGSKFVVDTNPAISNPTITGAALTFNPTAGTTTAFNETQTVSGTLASSLNANVIQINDTAQITGANFLSGLTVNDQLGAGTQGGRQSVLANLIVGGVPNASTSNQNFVALTAAATVSANQLGTGLTWTTAKGAIFATNPSAIAQSGATDLLELTGAEVNVALQTGSSAYLKAGWTIVGLASDAVQGTQTDAMLEFRNQGGAVGWNDGILFEDLAGNAQFPIKSNGNIMRASVNGATTVANGIDLSALTFTGSAFASPNFTVNGSGGIRQTAANAQNEIGSTSTPNTPFLDFHSSGNNIDYDSRIIASGGTGSVGQGTLTFQNAMTNMGAVTLFGSFFPVTGTASGAPIAFTAGTNLTTAAAGAVEYDGKVFYATAAASSRQVVNTEQVTILSADNTAPTNVATAQNVFPTGQGTLTVQGSTTYEFEAVYEIDTTGATSNSLQTLFGGTATFTSIGYTSTATNSTTSTVPAAASTRYATAATAVNVTAAVAAATQRQVILRGTMRINAAGTVIPQFQYSSAPGAAPVVRANSFFRCWPVGLNTVTSVGNWS